MMVECRDPFLTTDNVPVSTNLPTPTNSYTSFGSFHVHSLIFYLALVSFVGWLIGVPVWHYFADSFNILSIITYVIVLIGHSMVIIGNRRKLPRLYLPVFVLFGIGIGFLIYVIVENYIKIANNISFFEKTIQSTFKSNFGPESAQLNIDYLNRSFNLQLSFLSIAFIIYALNLILSDYFFMSEKAILSK